MTKRKRVGVLISGRGSNLQALINACKKRDYPAEIVLVISNVPQAQGLLRAEAALIPTLTINHKDFPIARSLRRRARCGAQRGRRRASLQRGLLAAAHARTSSSAGATAISTSTPRCCLPSEGSTPTSASSRQDAKSAAAPYISCAPRWMKARSWRRPPCRCLPATPPRRWRLGCSKPSIAFILMRLRSWLQAQSSVKGERVIGDGLNQRPGASAAFFAAARLNGASPRHLDRNH